MITPAQSRAARALLNWSQPQLAEASGASVSTIRDFETGKRAPIANNLAALRSALEAAGVIFVAENGEGPGARLSKLASALVDVCSFLRNVAKQVGPLRDTAAALTERDIEAHRANIEGLCRQIEISPLEKVDEAYWLGIEQDLQRVGVPLPSALKERVRSAARLPR